MTKVHKRALFKSPVTTKVSYIPSGVSFDKGLPISKEEIYPGRHLFNKSTVKGTIMEQLKSIVANERVAVVKRANSKQENDPSASGNSHNAAKENIHGKRLGMNKSMNEPSIDGKLLCVVVKQFDRRDAKSKGLVGCTTTETKSRYIRHYRIFDRRSLLLLKGHLKTRNPRRKWSLRFDETEIQLNRYIFAKSIMHPVLGYMNFDQFNFVMKQMWSDYCISDVSDIFTIMKLFSFLTTEGITRLPQFTVLHDYQDYHRFEPPGAEGAFREVCSDIYLAEETKTISLLDLNNQIN